MRYLTAILGVLALIVILGGPVPALAVKAPCHDASMAGMAMADDAAPCKPAGRACAEFCFAVGNCQSQCGSPVPFVRADLIDLAVLPVAMKLRAAGNDQPPGTASPVDGPPPRI